MRPATSKPSPPRQTETPRPGSVRLVCWNADQARERSAALERAGFEVDSAPLNPSGLIGHFRQHTPSVILIDLDRLPSHGREVGIALRQSKATRRIPLVYAGGEPGKAARVRAELPDAFYCAWDGVTKSLREALRHAPANPVQPPSHMERYTGAALPVKLGLKKGLEVSLLGAPDEFEEQLGELPEGAKLSTRLTRSAGLALWFVRSRRELESQTGYLSARLPEGCALWIVHPKRSGRYKVDFNQNDVRAAGLASGLVDFKVCSVDADWSGLKFARRKK
jgi:CheY-like chemotaxis protein